MTEPTDTEPTDTARTDTARTDTNASIWRSDEVVQDWTATASRRETKMAPRWRLMGELLPCHAGEPFTFLDLGAGTGAASREILALYPNSSVVLAEFSEQMIAEGTRAMQPWSGRYSYVEFDMSTGAWPDGIPTGLGAVISSLCIHHLPDARKQGLFGEIFERLAPGGWYLNYDPVTSDDPVVAAAWERAADRKDPDAAAKRLHRTPLEQARYENHVRHMIPLEQQLGYLRSAGFQGVDVYWKHLEWVVYGGCRPG